MARFCVSLKKLAAAASVVAGVFAAAISADALSSPAFAANDTKPAGISEIIYGDSDAPVTIVEYASLTCGHCANFHTEMMPLLKERLLDTGKAKVVFKDFPLDQLALRAAVMVRCNTGQRSRAMLDVLFRTQQSWARSQDPVGALMNIGRAAGMTDDGLQVCFNNQEIVDGVIKHRLDAENDYQVDSTPSFVIDGKLYRGGMSIEQFEQVVESLQP